MRPFRDNTASSKTITTSESVPGFEDAGVGRVAQLKEGMRVGEVVRLVKEHLALEHGELRSRRVASR